jgi:hypothetical protein
MRLNSSEFLLPRSARFQVVYANGNELDNRTAFSGCHEFLGESNLNSGTPSEIGVGPDAGTSKGVPALPSGFPFSVALTQPIHPSTAAAGDLVEARLTRAIHGKRNKVLAPRGAAVTARLVQMEWLYGSAAQTLLVGIKLETIEINGSVCPFDAKLESTKKRAYPPSGTEGLIRRQDLGTFDETARPDNAAVGYLTFGDVTKDFVIRSGFEIAGKTKVRP